MRNALGQGPEIAVHVQQGQNLTEPIKAAKAMAKEGKLLHPGDPVLDFGVFGAETEPGKTDPDKSQLKKIERGSDPSRIDGVVAWMTAWQTIYEKEAFDSRQPKKSTAEAVCAEVYTGCARGRREEEAGWFKWLALNILMLCGR